MNQSKKFPILLLPCYMVQHTLAVLVLLYISHLVEIIFNCVTLTNCYFSASRLHICIFPHPITRVSTLHRLMTRRVWTFIHPRRHFWARWHPFPTTAWISNFLWETTDIFKISFQLPLTLNNFQKVFPPTCAYISLHEARCNISCFPIKHNRKDPRVSTQSGMWCT